MTDKSIDAIVISDLHLKPEAPQTVKLFEAFVTKTAPTAKHLYILGDFFEFWIGDDAMDDFSRHIAALLTTLAKQGSKISIMPGNRDVMIGESFCQQSSATLLKDPTLINYEGHRVLLCHGDAYCTSDQHYMRYRKIATARLTRWLFHKLPISWRRRLAQKIRNESKKNFIDNPVMIDVTHKAIVDEMQRHHASIMIHGHTHKLLEEHYPNVGTRFVNADWHDTGSMIILNKGKVSTQKFSLDTL